MFRRNSIVIGTFVAARDRVVRIVGNLRSTQNVTPLSTDFGSGGDGDDLGGNGADEAGVAFDGCTRHVVNWLCIS